MKSTQLLDIINNVKQPYQILTELSKVNFSATDITEDGDTVLHVLAKSNHASKGEFSNYLEELLTAGADANVVDKQGNTFLSYYLPSAVSYDVDKTFDLLLEKGFDINQTFATDQTFFELIYNADRYNISHPFTTLIRRKEFNPNQKTSKHNSIVLHMISENVFSFREYLYDVVENVKTNPNIKNNNEQTALAQHLSNSQYKDMRLITALINHEQCDINALDKDGNNYLQLAVISCRYQAEDIVALLINKGINVAHKNHEGKTVFDLIAENQAKRSAYANQTLLLKILKLHPASLLEEDSTGKPMLSGLLRSKDYGITSEFRTLLELCKKQKNSTELLKKIISDCFNDFRQNLVPQETMESITKAIIEANIQIDVEHCFALTALGEPSLEKEGVYKNLCKIKTEVDWSEVIRHVKSLAKEGSDERLRALNHVCGLSLQLDCFDEAMLACEEQYLRAKTSPRGDQALKMFGHLFSLSGSVPVNNLITPLTGSSSSDTAPFMTHLMNAYVSHCETSGKHEQHLDAIRQVRNMTAKAMRFYFLSQSWGDYYPLMKASKQDFLSSMLADSKNAGVEIITGWSGHAVNLIVKGDDLYRNNGGGCSTDATTEHYKIAKTENLTEEMFAKLFKESHYESNKTYIQRDLHDILGLIFDRIITGKFQTVGNCSLESMLIALKIKYRLFLSESIADELFADTIAFFEQFYLEEYLSLHANSPTLPHLLMRFIIQKLIPEGKLELAGKLLNDHFTSESCLEIMQVEFMIQRWLLQKKVSQ